VKLEVRYPTHRIGFEDSGQVPKSNRSAQKSVGIVI
jgi:hypothetical protein